eukprot:7863221-Karenia_brevis.AAC.1
MQGNISFAGIRRSSQSGGISSKVCWGQQAAPERKEKEGVGGIQAVSGKSDDHARAPLSGGGYSGRLSVDNQQAT